jgi:hypothetical protein
VSLSVSPFSTEEPLALSEIVSAESRLAASSNDEAVRVEASKNTLRTVRPRSVGSFLTSRSATASKLAASSSRRSTVALSRSSLESR